MLALCGQGRLLAGDDGVSVPFVGCEANGQTGPIAAPKGTGVQVRIGKKAARALAYYQSEATFGVLAPRGWHCLGIYGSGGGALMVGPQEIDRAGGIPVTGPAVVLSVRYCLTSGRVDVAQAIARVFPAYGSFLTEVREMTLLPADFFPSGPYPADKLTYKSKAVVEYRTAAEAEGLGTQSALMKKNGSPIEGVAILIGAPPDLLLLSVRLPGKLSSLTPAIVRQAEFAAARTPTQ